MNFDPKFLARLQAQPAGIGLADQQVAVAMHPGAEISLTSFALAAAGGAANAAWYRIALSCHQGAIKTLFEHAAAWTYVATASGDFIFWAVA